MAVKPYIGIKRLWYGDVMTEALTPSRLKEWLSTATEIKNSHKDTYSFEQDDPEVTEYENELTGNTYYRDKTSNGKSTIKFSVGEYEYQMLVELMGGELIKEGDEVVGWASPTDMELINKAIVAMTKTGHFVVFTNAGIVGKTEMQEKNMTLGVTATCMDNPNVGVHSQYRFSGDSVNETV